MPQTLATKAAVVTDSLDAIIVTGLDGRITVWNDAAGRAYGYDPTAVLGQPAHMLVPLELRPDEQAIRDRVFSGATSEHYETRRLRQDGKTVDVSCTLSPIRNEHGAITACPRSIATSAHATSGSGSARS